MIGEMDLLLAHLSSELKFIKNGMLPALFIDSVVRVWMHISTVGCRRRCPGVRVSAPPVVLTDLRAPASSV